MIKIRANGKDYSLTEPTKLLDFLADRQVKPKLIVVELNGTIIPREKYGEVILQAEDSVEIVHMVGGG